MRMWSSLIVVGIVASLCGSGYGTFYGNYAPQQDMAEYKETTDYSKAAATATRKEDLGVYGGHGGQIQTVNTEDSSMSEAQAGHLDYERKYGYHGGYPAPGNNWGKNYEHSKPAAHGSYNQKKWVPSKPVYSTHQGYYGGYNKPQSWIEYQEVDINKAEADTHSSQYNANTRDGYEQYSSQGAGAKAESVHVTGQNRHNTPGHYPSRHHPAYVGGPTNKKLC